jgi:hypothetical protein
MAADETMTRDALELLGSKRNDAYEAALAALREDTQAWWMDTLAGDTARPVAAHGAVGARRGSAAPTCDGDDARMKPMRRGFCFFPIGRLLPF